MRRSRRYSPSWCRSAKTCRMTVVRFELSAADGSALPPFTAGAHVDVVIAPEYQRQYSLAGDPADSSKYVARHPARRRRAGGGSLLMHRVFREGRRIFISEPRNHFPLDEEADFTVLMGGGIGVTPLITMAHRLHALGKDFVLHYSARAREECGLRRRDRCTALGGQGTIPFLEGRRAGGDLSALIPEHRPGMKLYTCGSDRYMDAVF